MFGRCALTHIPEGFDFVQAVEWDHLLSPRWQAIRLSADAEIAEALKKETGAERLLIDAFHKDAYGGTGELADWNLAAKIVELSPIPVGLAGGLNPENVAEAIRRVRPAMVDVSSGVEASPGRKDREKVRAFVAAAKGA